MPIIKTLTNLDAIDLTQWHALIARCPDSTVFQTPEWLLSWWRHLGAGEPFILAAYEGDQLVGLAPLYKKPRAILGVTRDELHFIGAGHSDYNLFSSWDGSLSIVAALTDELARCIDAGACAQLAEIPQFSSTGICIDARLGTGLMGLQRLGTTPCPRLQVRGNNTGVAAVLRKDSLRRHYKALAKLGTIRIEHHMDPAVAARHLDELFRQHAARWDGTPYPSMFLKEANRNFYREMVASLGHAQRMVFTTVHVADAPAALHLGLRSRGDFIWYKPTFDPGLQKYSPGETLLKSLIEYAQEQDHAAFDFSRGDERFKSRFATSFDHNVTYEWLPRRLDRYCWEAARRARRTVRSWVHRRAAARAADGASAKAAESEAAKSILVDVTEAEAHEAMRSIARPSAETFGAELARACASNSVKLFPPDAPVPVEALPMRVDCLYHHGRMAWYFVQYERTQRLRSEERISLEGALILSTKKLLDSLTWHGLATAEWIVSAGGAHALRSLTAEVTSRAFESAARNEFLTAALDVARGEPAPAQPPRHQSVSAGATNRRVVT